MSTPIFDALLAESSTERRAVIYIALAEAQDRSDNAWAEFEAAFAAHTKEH